MVKSGAKITLMAEEPNSLSVYQLSSIVSHPGYFSVDQFFDQGFFLSSSPVRIPINFLDEDL